jgi:hypothetical protein
MRVLISLTAPHRTLAGWLVAIVEAPNLEA